MSKLGYLVLLLICIGCVILCVLFSGCKDSHHRQNNDFIKEVKINETNLVSVVLDIPDNRTALLSIDNAPTANNVVLHDGEVVLGVFQAGDYSVSVEILDTKRIDSQRFTVYPLSIVVPPPPPPPPPPSQMPELYCNANSDGAVVCVIELNSSPFVFLIRVDSNEQPILIDQDTTLVTVPLDEGVYTFRLSDEDVVLNSCTVEVDSHDNDNGDPGDSFEIPPQPEDPKTRFNVCHNGHNLLLPWHALKAHSRHPGDKLGKCD